ncbi:hypothetical protein Lalb_Chr16g0385721 [Lupinus albus]|uniref:GCK domain-containing protein n=1 Tax=Lupinus albus TaxID=3870 RepID=A0A6A4P711_LUPAL|nr:hypothetical protein Lalb_Chr16g0385721 [Lupinus albus]
MSSPDSEPPQAQPFAGETLPPLQPGSESPEPPKAEERDVEEEEEEEKGECGFCLFMKAGGCKDAFIDWENCIEEAEKNKEDLVEKCAKVTAVLKQCMDSHSDYYEPILRAEKAAEKQAVEELEKEKELEALKDNASGSKSNDEKMQATCQRSFRNAGMLECWNAGMLECWNAGMQEGLEDIYLLKDYAVSAGSSKHFRFPSFASSALSP